MRPTAVTTQSPTCLDSFLVCASEGERLVSGRRLGPAPAVLRGVGPVPAGLRGADRLWVSPVLKTPEAEPSMLRRTAEKQELVRKPGILPALSN